MEASYSEFVSADGAGMALFLVTVVDGSLVVTQITLMLSRNARYLNGAEKEGLSYGRN
jgi:hypothetical protein